MQNVLNQKQKSSAIELRFCFDNWKFKATLEREEQAIRQRYAKETQHL